MWGRYNWIARRESPRVETERNLSMPAFMLMIIACCADFTCEALYTELLGSFAVLMPTFRGRCYNDFYFIDEETGAVSPEFWVKSPSSFKLWLPVKYFSKPCTVQTKPICKLNLAPWAAFAIFGHEPWIPGLVLAFSVWPWVNHITSLNDACKLLMLNNLQRSQSL